MLILDDVAMRRLPMTTAEDFLRNRDAPVRARNDQYFVKQRHWNLFDVRGESYRLQESSVNTATKDFNHQASVVTVVYPDPT